MIADITRYAGHFLACCANFMDGPLGVLVVGMLFAFFVAWAFSDLRR